VCAASARRLLGGRTWPRAQCSGGCCFLGHEQLHSWASESLWSRVERWPSRRSSVLRTVPLAMLLFGSDVLPKMAPWSFVEPEVVTAASKLIGS
jgi:hypothetical protein